MLSFAVLSEDIRRKRYLTLLCEDAGFLPADAEKAVLLLADTDTVLPPSRRGVIAVGKDRAIADKLGLPFLLYPMDEETFPAFCLASLSSPSALTPREAHLFALLQAANGKTVPSDVLLREVFGEGVDKGILPVYIHYLRQKIEKDGKKRIFSEKGKGYAYRC